MAEDPGPTREERRARREARRGMDIAYDGTWGYHPLVVSLAETGEVLRLVNRSGNRSSHEGAAAEVDRAIWLCLRAGHRRIVLRGDTDFSQTEHLDRWHALPEVRFVFGYDAMPNLKTIAENLPESAWQPLQRPARYEVTTRPRQRPDPVKDRIVRECGFDVWRLQSEEVAEFDYRPTACVNTYRMVVIRKHISKEKGEQVLWPEERYFFYITKRSRVDARRSGVRGQRPVHPGKPAGAVAWWCVPARRDCRSR